LKKIAENEPCFPKGEYAISKLKAEELAVKICREKDIRLTILRLATVIGEGDRGNVLRLIKAIDKKRFLMIGKGENYKTLIYKKDAARACRFILEKRNLSEKEAEILNVAAEPVQMKFIIEKISEALVKKQPKFFLPMKLIQTPLKFFSVLFPSGKIKSLSETLSKWASNEMFSNKKIEQKYSFKPETAISEAIGREVNFYIRKQKC
jgi:nucleoside-diphosphate-sugar epimerase